MQIEERNYSREEFKKYLIDHSEEILLEGGHKRWFKVYGVLVSNESWKNTLFKPGELKRMGEIFRVITELDGNSDADQYYIEEYCPGLLLIYNTATNEDYQEDLGNRIDHSRGVTRMWMKPSLFSTFWKGILNEANGYVYRFMSKRSSADIFPCKLRPGYIRRFNYSGSDGTQTLAELEELYGVTPESIYMQIDGNLKIHITNDGLYSAQQISELSLGVFFHHLDEIKKDILNMRTVSQSLTFDIVTNLNLKTVLVKPGIIRLKDAEVDSLLSRQMIKLMNEFSFIEVYEESGSFSLNATVVDEIKGSIFNITASDSQILIVPKFRLTFESFINFYRGIVESIDEYAEFSLLHN